jgi:hypothetical protein
LKLKNFSRPAGFITKISEITSEICLQLSKS